LGAIRMLSGGHASGRVEARERQAPRPRRQPAIVPLAERSRLGRRLATGEFAVSIELAAPSGGDADGALARIQAARAAGIDVVNVADGPRATARMSNLAFCTRAATLDVEPILHVCARDRNYLGLIAHLLGAHALGLRNLCVITGDP